MTIIDILTSEEFISELRNTCSSINSRHGQNAIATLIDNTGTWPHFEIRGTHSRTPVVSGYFVERSDSFLQISTSGTEIFTGNRAQAAFFLKQITAVLEALAVSGCVETTWREDAKKPPCRSLIKLQTSLGVLIFGQAPFWRKTLNVEQVIFEPYSQRLS